MNVITLVIGWSGWKDYKALLQQDERRPDSLSKKVSLYFPSICNRQDSRLS